MSIDLDLDCRGLLCPLPVIELGKRYVEVPVGGLVAVLADDVAARTDIPAWCRMRGQEFVGEEEPGRYVVRRLS
ncbi:preprotein translocase subunit TatB [Nocardioides sp. Root1257]|uniref:sulfurtransferase TusA family protein n=1 Tax=unclassified Nocardioides TaxID=2615069 RepID=UPI0006F97203|nr:MULTISPECIES: sulfurtransferase TusA family protein [unclassified Nocardioides]KQW53412.1 preprotein translocase subunit TatB [Nocardioides sp. Root1257]KRC56098.1 preprotein translocase subunit TatB [Nocardioides sp. Root224]